MRSPTRGRKGRNHELGTRRAQIDNMHKVVHECRTNYEQLTKQLDTAASTYKISSARLSAQLAKLEQSTGTVNPKLIEEVKQRLEEAGRHLSGATDFKEKLTKGYEEMMTCNLQSVELWEREIKLLTLLGMPGTKMSGWAWAKEEPAEYEDDDEAYAPTETSGTCGDELNVQGGC